MSSFPYVVYVANTNKKKLFDEFEAKATEALREHDYIGDVFDVYPAKQGASTYFRPCLKFLRFDLGL